MSWLPKYAASFTVYDSIATMIYAFVFGFCFLTLFIGGINTEKARASGARLLILAIILFGMGYSIVGNLFGGGFNYIVARTSSWAVAGIIIYLGVWLRMGIDKALKRPNKTEIKLSVIDAENVVLEERHEQHERDMGR